MLLKVEVAFEPHQWVLHEREQSVEVILHQIVENQGLLGGIHEPRQCLPLKLGIEAILDEGTILNSNSGLEELNKALALFL